MATITALGFSIFSQYDGDGVRRARNDLQSLTNSYSGANRGAREFASGMGLARTAALALAPALLPIGEVALGAAGGLAAMGTTAGTALGVYGAAMAGAIKRTEEMRAANQKLEPAQQNFIKHLDGMRDAWDRFIQATQDKTLATASVGLEAATIAIGKLKPIVDATHPSIMRLAQAFRDWTARDNGLERFIDIVIKYGVPALDKMIQAGRDMSAVLGMAFRAFLPLIQPITDALAKGAAELRKWAEGGGFERFVERVRQNAPAVIDALKSLWDLFKRLMEVVRELSPISLELVTNLAKIVSAIPTPVLVGLVAGFVALRTALGGLLLPLALLRTFFGGGGVFSMIGSALPIIAKFAGILGVLATAVALAWKHSEFFRDRVKELWDALKRLWEAIQPLVQQLQMFWAKIEPIRQALGQVIGFILGVAIGAITMFVNFLTALTQGITKLWEGFNNFLSSIPGIWNTVWQGMQTAAQAVWNALQTAWNAVCTAFGTAWTAVSGALQAAWNAVWNGLQTAAQAVWTALQTAWNAVCTAFSTAWTAVSGALQAAWNAVWNALQTAAQAVWTALQTAWNAVCTAFTTVWSAVSGALSAAWNAVWQGIQTAAQAVWTALQTAWNAVCQAFQTAWQAVSSALTAAWNAVWQALQTAAQAVWQALQTAWDAFLNAMRTAWDAVSSALRTAWDAVWNALRTAAEAVWNAIRTAWDAVLNALRTAWDTFSNALRTAWETFWNAVKTAAETVWNAIRTAWDAFFSALRTAWDTFSNALRTAWESFWNAIKTAAEAVWNAVKDVWNGFLKFIRDVWDDFSGAFERAWEATWNTVKDVASEVWDKIKGVIEDAINFILKPVNMLIDGFNAIAGAVGLDIEIPNISVNFAAGGIIGDMPKFEAGGVVNFARGGVIPGYAPGKDTVNAMLSKGEGVLVPEAVKALGPNFVHWANYTFSHGRGGKNVAYPGYAMGGVAGGCGPCGLAGGGVAGCKTGNCGTGCGYANGGVVGLGGLTQAWHRTGGKTGWGFQGGGVVQGDGDPPPVVGPGGVVTPQDDDGLSGGADLPSPGDIVEGTLGVLTGGLGGLGGQFGTSSLVLGFIGEQAIRAAFDATMAAFEGMGVGGEVGKIMLGAGKHLAEKVIEWLVNKDKEAHEEYMAKAVAGAQSCQAWAPLASQAMALAGLNQMQLPAFLSLLCAESGGNPNAINNWDSNAAAGMPSQGLMQVIPPTFAANHVPGTSNNILDPLANMAAAARYIMNRYGGVVPGSPYADGTDSATPGLHLVGEEGPELVGLNGPGMANFSGGQSVMPAAETAALLDPSAAATTTEAAPVGALTDAASGSGLVLPKDETQQLLNEGGFEGISQAAEIMAAAVKQAWMDANAASAAQWALMVSTTMQPAVTMYGTEMPAAALAMQTASSTAWMDMNLQSATQWALMRDTTFLEAETHYGTTMPTMITTLQTTSNAAWLDMQTQSTLQWTTMRDGVFLPMEEHMSVTMVEAVTTMQEAVVTAFETMGEAITTVLDAAIAKMDEFIAKAQEAIQVTAELVAAVQEAQAAMAALNSMGTPGAAGGAGGAGGGAYEQIAAEALAAAGISADQLPAFMALMMAESGGDPNAINNWDSNAAAGTPSMGLMQMIQPTFDAYNVTGGNIMDPRANMFASAAYIAARYGGIVPGSPYARGTSSATSGVHIVGEEGPELVGMDGAMPAWFRGGERVFTNSDTQQILANAVSATGAALIPELDKTISAIDQFIAIAKAGIAKAKAITAAAKAAAAAGARGAGNGSCAIPSGTTIIQGPNNPGGVAASAGTHDGGGVYDFPADAALLSQLQANGFAAWMRGNGDGMDPHIHAVCMNAPDLSPQAAWQVQDYLAGGSGLGIPGNLHRGTNSALPGWSWIGERGPELMRMRGGEKVMSHNRSMDAMERMWGMGNRWHDDIASAADSVSNSGHGRGGCNHNIEFNFNGPVNNGDDVRRAVDESIPKLRTAIQQKCGT